MITPTDILDALRRLEEQIIDPEMRRSPHALAALLSDGFLEFTASGQVYDAGTILPALAAQSAAAPVAMRNQDYEMRPLADDLVLLTYRNVVTRPGAPDVHSLRSSIWRRTGEAWRLVFHQGTPTTAPVA